MGKLIPDVYIDIDQYIIRTMITTLHMPRERVIIARGDDPVPDYEWEIDYKIVDITYNNTDTRSISMIDCQTDLEDLGIDEDKLNEKVSDEVIAMFTNGGY